MSSCFAIKEHFSFNACVVLNKRLYTGFSLEPHAILIIFLQEPTKIISSNGKTSGRLEANGFAYEAEKTKDPPRIRDSRHL